ncbi:MAG: linear amide C-N hydrolase [Anaerolineae bacterium]
MAAVLCLLGLVALAIPLLGPLQTLASFHKVDEYPLYVMRYHGGYLFDHYLQQGIEKGFYGAIYQRLYRANYPQGCTVFVALNPQGEVLFGRNFDWRHRASLLLFTDPPGGYASVSMVDIHYFGFGKEKPSWVDRLSLLATPYATVDGMNEHGLAVAELAVPGTGCKVAPPDPEKATILSAHVMRLVLDHAANVAEALDLIEKYNVHFPDPCTHHLIADAAGSSAIVEYVGGRVVVTRNAEPWQVATNFLACGEGPRGDEEAYQRYEVAYGALQEAGGIISEAEALEIARQTSKENTVWSALYNLTTGEVHLALGRQYDQVYRFNLPLNRQAAR